MRRVAAPRGDRLAGLLAVLAMCLVTLGPASAARSGYGGTLVVGELSGEPDSLDPTVARTGPATEVLNSMCAGLYELEGNHGSLEDAPVLAATPPILSADKLSFTVQLRQGIEFNDGTPLNAQAVVTSYQRYTTYPGSAAGSGFTDITSVTANGPYTVVFHLAQPDSVFTGDMDVLSPTALAAEGANFGANPVCAGPFMFDHWDPGVDVTLIKSPYWYKRAAVHLDKIVFKPMTDAATAVAALETGDVQAIAALPASEVPEVQQDASLKLLATPTLAWNGIVINIGNKHGLGDLPYTNVGTPLAESAKLRQAFEEAIDRVALNKVVFGGLNRPSCTPVPAANTEWYRATEVPCTPYDPSQARKLVAESGFPDPTVHYLTFNSSAQLLLAQFIQSEEAAVGIKVVIDAPDIATYAALHLSGAFDTTADSSGTKSADPSYVIDRLFATTGTGNVGGYANTRLDYVLASALKARTFKARAVYYRVAQEIILHDRPSIVLYNPVNFAAFNAKLVAGVELRAYGLFFANAQLR
jgi:peptide/nickel transport system substrate-binding protein